MRDKVVLGIAFFCVFLSSCEEKFTPKPRGFERIEFPARKYISYTNPCNYTMQIPVYSSVEKDPYPTAEPCWYNVYFKPFNATLHLSYKEIRERKDLFKLIEDSRTLVYKHTIRADEIIENTLANERLHGIFYELTGNTATNVQFYVTDSSHNFLRGSLYFNQQTDADSIAPALAFLKSDILRMLNTLEWR